MANFRPMDKADYEMYPLEYEGEGRIWEDAVAISSLSCNLISSLVGSNKYQLDADVIETNYLGEDDNIYFVIDNISSEQEVDRIADRIVSIIKHDKFTLIDSLKELGAKFINVW